MPGIAHKPDPSGLQRWLLAILLLFLPLHGLHADEAIARRVLVGLKIFPAVLAASEALERAPAMRQMRVLLVYHDDPDYAEELAVSLRGIGRIKNIPLRVETAPIHALQEPRQGPPPFGVFVCQRSAEEIALIAGYGRQHGTITFSPFRGDVEQGILAGIAISDRILPLLNKQTLAELPLGLKAFFLRVAEIYEP
jgi:hypothetical protein